MKKLVLFIFLFPIISLANYTGERILKAAQKYGLTDSELNYLIDNTAPDLTLRDPKFGATALIHSCINNRPNMVRILIEKGGANIDDVDNNGETCLIGASRKGNVDVVKILLEFGANTAVVGNVGKSAYDYAVESGHTEVARLLGGAPKQKISFKSLAKLAVPKKGTAGAGPAGGGAISGRGVAGGGGVGGLSAQKYASDLGKIALTIKKWEEENPSGGMAPGGTISGATVSGVGGGSSAPAGKNSEKVNEIRKITGFSDVVKKQMEERNKLEEKVRVEKEAKKSRERGQMMAKLKAIAAFNNLYLDVQAKGKSVQPGSGGGVAPTGGGEVTPSGSGGAKKYSWPMPKKTATGTPDTSALNFSDATNVLINDMEMKRKQREEELEREKKLEEERIAAEKIKIIKGLIYAGTKGNDINALKNESEEKLKEKIEAIKNVTDVKESKQVSWATARAARSKITVFSMIDAYDKDYQNRLNAIKREEEEQKKKAAMDAKLELERKQAEEARKDALEQEEFYKVVSNKAKISKLSENWKRKTASGKETAAGGGGGGAGAAGVAITGGGQPVQPEGKQKSRYLIDDGRGVVKTPDFNVWMPTANDCSFMKTPKGNHVLLISKLKFTEVKAGSRISATWFINQSENPTPRNGGKSCSIPRCTDLGVYLLMAYNNPRRERFINNITINMGLGKNDHFEIYSSVEGNPPLRIPVSVCKGYSNY